MVATIPDGSVLRGHRPGDRGCALRPVHHQEGRHQQRPGRAGQRRDGRDRKRRRPVARGPRRAGDRRVRDAATSSSCAGSAPTGSSTATSWTSPRTTTSTTSSSTRSARARSDGVARCSSRRGLYLTTDLGPWSQNLVLPVVTRLPRGRRVMFPLPIETQEIVEYLRERIASDGSARGRPALPVGADRRGVPLRRDRAEDRQRRHHHRRGQPWDAMNTNSRRVE